MKEKTYSIINKSILEKVEELSEDIDDKSSLQNQSSVISNHLKHLKSNEKKFIKIKTNYKLLK